MASRPLSRTIQRPVLQPRLVLFRPTTCKARALSLEALDQRKGDRERILILGSGWAGYGLARSLDTKHYQPILITPRTYFVFTPLLASTAVGTLEFRTAMESSRTIKGVETVRGWADSVDLPNKTLSIEGAFEPSPNKLQSLSVEEQEAGGIIPSSDNLFAMKYDKLVIAVGCYSQTFNTPGVTSHAFFLKDVADARKIRRRIIERFEEAALPTIPLSTKRELLHFAIVGGGPTGIEFAAELHDLIKEDLEKRGVYGDLAGVARITVYDVAPQILSMFDEGLRAYAARVFGRQGISVQTSHHVERVERDAVVTKEEGRVKVGAVVWSTGLAENPFVTNALGREWRFGSDGDGKDGNEGGQVYGRKNYRIVKDRKAGRIQTDSHLRAMAEPSDGSFAASHLDDVFALGDCAKVGDSELPATAQVASQQARYLAKTLNMAARKQHTLGTTRSPSTPRSSAGTVGNEREGGKEEGRERGREGGKEGTTVDVSDEKEFKFRSLGVMAYLGGWRAITQGAGGKEIKGRLAWVLWRTAYLTKSVSWRNKVLIPVYWALNWIGGRDVNRF